MKIVFFIDEERYEWIDKHHKIFTVREDQVVYFELYDLNEEEKPPLFVEDYELNLTPFYPLGEECFRSEPYPIFRESFGTSIVSVCLSYRRIELYFDVLVKKVNAQQVEEMICYLTQKREDMIRICLSRTSLSLGITEHGSPDPETILNAVEKFVNSLISCRLELQSHLRKRLVPVKIPAWRYVHGGDIDAFDIIHNLDALEPVLGVGDVLIHGKNFSLNNIDISTLETTVDVYENSILLGSLYSMRRVIRNLLANINVGFSHEEIAQYDQEYESLNNVLLRLTSSNMKQRCENHLANLEELIRYFEQEIGLTYQGEIFPLITPFVRSSRVYRRLFEQIHDWYKLGEPTLDGRKYLAKLRSVSKIYEFVALFKLIDYLYERDWETESCSWSSEYSFVPSSVFFEKHGFKLALHYEKKIYPYSEENTRHFDLVDMKHLKDKSHDYRYLHPDFLIKLDCSDSERSCYMILDAKYSQRNAVQKYHLPDLADKYYDKMSVYDAHNQCLRQNAILGIVALFPSKDSNSPVYLPQMRKFGIDKIPVKLPVVMGLSVSPQFNESTSEAFDKIFSLLEHHVKVRPF